MVEVARPNATATNVEQHFYSVADDDKRRAVLKQIVKERGITQALVFVNSKLGCARLARSFERDGLRTNALHGDKSQDERLKALEAFKAGEVDVLVATDVAARGLDIVDLPAVFNFDVPFNAEDYVHRIGRTGRAGASGLAVTLVSRDDDARLVADIEKLIKKKIELEPLELEEDRPRGRINDGRRALARRGRGRRCTRRARRSRANAPRRAACARRGRPHRAPSAPRDPFFDKPYEAPGDARPRRPGKPPPRPRRPRGLSANIKPKRKVAALFKSGSRSSRQAVRAPEIAGTPRNRVRRAADAARQVGGFTK